MSLQECSNLYLEGQIFQLYILLEDPEFKSYPPPLDSGRKIFALGIKCS